MFFVSRRTCTLLGQPAVPELRTKLEAQREKGYRGWPSVPLTALAAEPCAVEGILAAIQQLMEGRGPSDRVG